MGPRRAFSDMITPLRGFQHRLRVPQKESLTHIFAQDEKSPQLQLASQWPATARPCGAAVQDFGGSGGNAAGPAREGGAPACARLR
jgi:hypothetical protein